MVKITLRLRAPQVMKDISEYLAFLKWYLRSRVYKWFAKFEIFKNLLVDLLYKKRGKYVRPFLHFGTIGLIFFAIIIGPVIFTSGAEQQRAASNVLSSVAYGSDFLTKQAEEVRQFRGGEIIVHVVAEGETISSIATLYGLQQDTILWENDLTAKSKIKPGDELDILPIDGVRHKVTRGETIYSVGKKYKLDSAQVQVIVDYPFNEFLNDETFELATGQHVMVPDGVRANITANSANRSVYTTPDAGSVTASGSFVWPASGRITQSYRFYHKAWDIANSGGGPILAADAGTVVSSGWDGSGYGNKVVIDHGNGFITLYAHNSLLQVRVGQRVNRGDVIAQMGSTGRSTGTHLHFEIRQGGVLLNPGNFLR
jgi:murein DD-endopeptidase MepM/ murein hydrolase activator NlpD